MERTPEAAAVVFGDECLSYRELNTRANRLAPLFALSRRRAGIRVGIFVERSVEMVVGTAGRAQGRWRLPATRPHLPKRRASVLSCKTPARTRFLTQRRFTEALQEHALPVVVLDDERPPFAAESAETPAVSVADDNLSYSFTRQAQRVSRKG